MRNRLLARGRSQDLQSLQQLYPAVPANIAQKLSAAQQEIGLDAALLNKVRLELLRVQQTANEADQPKFAGLAQTLNQSAASVRGLAAADKPVLQLRLIELFEATAAVAGSSLTAFNLDVGRLLHLLRVQAACVGDLSVPAAHPVSYTWFPYAQAQLAIRAAASSPQAALLLLGPHPIEEEHLRWDCVFLVAV